jgi:hypothetical protein
VVQRISLLAAVLVLTLAGFLQRAWTERADEELVRAAAKLDRVPLTLGTWRGQTLELDAQEIARARYASALWRRYEETTTGRVVSLLLVCGRPGPLSVHTPDACYPGAGFALMTAPEETTVPLPASAEAAVFWKARFARLQNGVHDQLRIYWSWNAGTGWQAVESPRLRFARFPVLYKLYVVSALAPADTQQPQDAGLEFLRQLLPVLEPIVAAPTAEE